MTDKSLENPNTAAEEDKEEDRLLFAARLADLKRGSDELLVRPDFDEDPKEKDDPQNVVFSCPVDHEGTAVYVKGWVRPNPEKRAVVIVHGLGENVGHYREAARRLHEHGFSVFGFDLRGHGRSGRVLGHIPNFNALVNDLLQVVNWIRHKSERTAPFIVGQGIGALVVMNFQRQYPKFCPATVLLSPCFVPAPVSFSKRFLIRSLAEMSAMTRLPKSLTPRFLAPSTTTRKGVKPSFSRVTLNFAKEVLHALDQVPAQFRDYNCPSLILCPKQDGVFEYDKLYEMIGRHSFKNKFEMREFDTAEGNLLISDGDLQARVIDMIAAWLDAQERLLHELKTLPRQAAVHIPEGPKR